MKWIRIGLSMPFMVAAVTFLSVGKVLAVVSMAIAQGRGAAGHLWSNEFLIFKN